MLSDEKRTKIDEVRDASNSQGDDGIYQRRRDVRAGRLPIDSRVVQPDELWDGRLVLLVRPLSSDGSRP